MTARPSGGAGRRRASYVNRVSKTTDIDIQASSPDVLTQVKVAVSAMDDLEKSDNASWQTRVASLSSKYRTLFDVGDFIRSRYRYYTYGLETSILNDLLSELGPLSIPSLTKWLSWKGATDTGTLSIPDRLGGSPATQSSESLKPTLGTSDNGVNIATFDSDVLVLPLSAAINDNIKFGIAFWVKLSDVSGVKTFTTIQSTAGGASANKLFVNTFGAALQTRALAVDRRANPSTASLDTNWRFCYIGIDCSQATEATQVIMSLDALSAVLSFVNDTAWPASLGTPTGNMLIGATTVAGGSPLVGSIGDIFFFSDQLSAADQARLMQFNRPL